MVMEYMFNLKNGQLRMHVSVDDKRHIEYKVYDNDTDEEYIPRLVASKKSILFFLYSISFFLASVRL